MLKILMSTRFLALMLKLELMINIVTFELGALMLKL